MNRPRGEEGDHTASEGKPLRRAVSVAIARGERVLAVLRPPDDPDLPDLWGLPAAGVREGETPREAALRIGPAKLGVGLAALRLRATGEIEREAYRLRMELFDGSIEAGEPEVPQGDEGVTQYVDLRWADPELLRPAARRGSLCCRLHLESGGDA